MAAIESILTETRVFPPDEAFVKQANVSGMAAYQALCQQAETDYEGFWADQARQTIDLEQAVHPHARRIEGAVLQVVRRWRTERLLQLPGPPSGHPGRQDRADFRGRRRRGDEGHLQATARARLPVCQWPEVARRGGGRPGDRLHADEHRSGGGDAGLRAHRRDSFGGVRRLLVEEPVRAHRRCQGQDHHHRRRIAARRQGGAAEARGRRVRWRWATRPVSSA